MDRRLVASLLASLLLVACSGGGAPSPIPSPSPISSSAAPTTAASVAPSEGACREVEHALGTTCVPTDPKRVVTLGYQTALEYALAMGLPVVGFDGDAAAPDHVPTYLDPSLVAGATFVGDGSAPDLEKVKALEPDLIIYTFDNGNYPQVSEIAPTVVLSISYVSYRDDFLAAAELLDRTDEAQAFLGDLDARLAEVKAEIAPVIEGKTVSVFRTTADGKGQMSGQEDYVGELFKDLGATRPAEQQGPYQEISLEQIGILDADVGFAAFGLANHDPEVVEANEANRRQFESSALWSTLKFVQDDQLYQIDPNVFGLHGIYWAEGMANEVSRSVAAH
jgi:iron complex transport system substrate-binding protein